MIFLIDYDRPTGKLVTFRRFEDSQKREARRARLDLEIELNNQGIMREIVLLDAASEADIRKTHRRYFEDLQSLARLPLP